MTDKVFSMAIVGAGAAGLLSAIWAARTTKQNPAEPLTILLLDSQNRIGAKILMSGGTRCNVTHQEVRPSDYQGGSSPFIKHVLEAFTPEETIQFFGQIGVKLVPEPGGKYFPETHSAQTVLAALVRETERTGVILKKGVRIIEIKKQGDLFYLKSLASGPCYAKKVILTTGGLSYPGTGSDGTGYEIAKSFGHTIVGTFPALTPFLTGDTDWKSLRGVALEAKLTFFKKGKRQCSSKGSFLFTHFGFSGPVVLDISRHWASAGKEDHPRIEANFLPDEDETALKADFDAGQRASPKKRIKNFLAEKYALPIRFVEIFLEKVKLNQDMAMENFSKENHRQFIESLRHYPLEITGVYGYQKAEVTAGGVALKEVKGSSMESRIVPGLYFAGEILDVDGRIGGFNFQWAWSTGAMAGRSAARSLMS